MDIEMFADDDLYSIGVFPIEQVFAAFDAVETNGDEYDLVTNNCGALVLQMMCNLNVPVSQDLIDWGIERISSDGERSAVLLNMLEGSEAKTRNLELIWTGDIVEVSNVTATHDLIAALAQYSVDNSCAATEKQKDAGSVASTLKVVTAAAASIAAAML